MSGVRKHTCSGLAHHTQETEVTKGCEGVQHTKRASAQALARRHTARYTCRRGRLRAQTTEQQKSDSPVQGDGTALAGHDARLRGRARAAHAAPVRLPQAPWPAGPERCGHAGACTAAPRSAGRAGRRRGRWGPHQSWGGDTFWGNWPMTLPAARGEMRAARRVSCAWGRNTIKLLQQDQGFKAQWHEA